jgi:hypothetical protein
VGDIKKRKRDPQASPKKSEYFIFLELPIYRSKVAPKENK